MTSSVSLHSSPCSELGVWFILPAPQIRCPSSQNCHCIIQCSIWPVVSKHLYSWNECIHENIFLFLTTEKCYSDPALPTCIITCLASLFLYGNIACISLFFFCIHLNVSSPHYCVSYHMNYIAPMWATMMNRFFNGYLKSTLRNLT